MTEGVDDSPYRLARLNLPSLAGRTVLDVGAKWKARQKLTVDVRVDNTLDEIYADSGSATAWLLGQPRALTVSLNVVF